MNQILVTKKLYVTPELKKKKKFYRLEFFLSVFLICLLFSYYIYAEYDKNRSEEVSKDILSNININTNQEDETTIKSEDNILVVILDEEEQPAETEKPQEKTIVNQEIKVAKDGTEYTTVGIINIPKIDVNYPVLSKTTDELLKKSPCKFWGGEMNEVGNYCIAGHNYRNKKFFSKVPTLENGDIIELTDLAKERTIKYVVYKKYTVNPEDRSCTSQKTNGKKEITLITCTDDNQQRVIVKATEVI